MSITLRRGAGDYHLLAAGEACSCKLPRVTHDDVELADPGRAAGFLRGCLGTSSFAASMRRLLDAAGSHVRETDPDALVKEGARLLGAGRLRVVGCRYKLSQEQGPDAPRPAAPPPPEEAREIKETRERHWVEFRIVEDRSGKAVAGFTLNLRLPGSAAPAGVPAENGTAHTDGVTPGTCEILDAGHDEVWEVTELSSA